MAKQQKDKQGKVGQTGKDEQVRQSGTNRGGGGGGGGGIQQSKTNRKKSGQNGQQKKTEWDMGQTGGTPHPGKVGQTGGEKSGKVKKKSSKVAKVGQKSVK